MSMKQNKALKVISYILLPVFIGIIIISILYTLAKDSYSKNMDNYFDTTSFTSDYMELVGRLARSNIYKYDNLDYVEDGKYKIYYVNLNNYDYDLRLKNHYIMIIYNNKVITNIEEQKIDTLEKMKKYISEQNRRKVRNCKWRSEKIFTCGKCK